MFKELEAIKARVKEMEEEAEKLKEMQKQVEETIMSPPASQPACKIKRQNIDKTHEFLKFRLTPFSICSGLCRPG